MTGDNQKKSTNLMIRLEEELFQKFKEICEKKGQTMSKRLRQFIEDEIKEIKIYDYDSELENSKNRSKEIVNSISLLYFDNNNVVRQHEFFVQKTEEFILNLSSYIFLNKMGRKTLSSVMDNFGDSIKEYSLLSNIITNIKDGLESINKYKEEVNNFYKDLSKI